VPHVYPSGRARSGEALGTKGEAARLITAQSSHDVVSMAVATLPAMLRTLSAALRTAVMAPYFFFRTMVISAKANRVARKVSDVDAINSLAEQWVREFNRVPPLRITVEGTENIDPDQVYIVVSNHLSNFDIPVAVEALKPLRVRFISKIEVSRVPVFGAAAVNAGVVMLDRGAARKNHDHLNQEVGKSLADGLSILVFAEGTRSRTGEMGDFRRGAVRLALAAGVDILPIVIQGTYEINPPGSPLIYPGAVTVRVLPPVSLNGMSSSDVPAVTDELRRVIGEHYDELAARQAQS
jgi:1-acyl-sn-glycerol-3-phosphate acyltransferase